MIKNIFLTLKVLLMYSLVLLILLPIRILGIFLIPIGLLFTKDLNVNVPYTQYPELGNWNFIILPEWLKIFNNIVDGVRGDRRGWYHNDQKNKSEFFRRYWWTAFRNPTNYLNRFILSIDVSKVTVKKIYGKDKVDNKENMFGIQLLEAISRESGNKYYHFQLVFGIPYTKKCCMFRVGYKFDLDDNSRVWEGSIKRDYQSILDLAIKWRKQEYLSDSPIERFKGFTVRIFPVIKDYK